MKLKFIGKHGSMGLCHGQEYYVNLSSTADYICATIFKDNGTLFCPYSSPQSFAANWKKESANKR